MAEATSNPIGNFTFKDLTNASQERDSGRTDPEFKEFENLTGKLLKVPKEELDAKRREQEGD